MKTISKLSAKYEEAVLTNKYATSDYKGLVLDNPQWFKLVQDIVDESKDLAHVKRLMDRANEFLAPDNHLFVTYEEQFKKAYKVE